MGIPTLIKTLTASDSASLAFVDGAASVTLDSTYDEYMFMVTIQVLLQVRPLKRILARPTVTQLLLTTLGMIWHSLPQDSK
jgi:hypothetical protein